MYGRFRPRGGCIRGWYTSDPNDEMFTEDEDEDKAKEFERIVRRREYVRRTERLRENMVGPALDEFWDGQHLSDAIEKTVVTHPYTMWHF